MAHAVVLVVDDEPLIRRSIRERLASEGYEIREAGGGAEARSQLASTPDLVLLDVNLRDADGFDLLREIRARAPETPVIPMTASSTIENAVDAMKLGAYHYINKPFNVDELALHAEQALEMGRLRREMKAIRASQRSDFGFEAIVGTSPQMVAVKALLGRIAAGAAFPVLLNGEPGTGKDLAAKVIHYNSDRANQQFVYITCSALPEQVLESELFGHERGAFTDGRQQRRGLLETADGGTVFLDEIDEATSGLQAKLLRFLEEKTFKRVGGLVEVRSDVRLIAATHRNLEQLVQERTFREDLFYRLQVTPVVLPPLRERRGDIPLLINYYADCFNREFKKKVTHVSAPAMKVVEEYGWPGNIRELRNAIERAMLLIDGPTLETAHLTMLARASGSARFQLPPEGVRLEDLERSLLIQALERSGGNQTQAGEMLGINRDQVRYRIEKFGLTKPSSSTATAVASSPTHPAHA